MKSIQIFGVNDLRIIEKEKPVPGENEYQLRIRSVGICGSDVHYLKEGGTGDVVLDQPMVLGHEFSGTIQSGPMKGRLAAVDPGHACGECEFCKDGKPNFCTKMKFAGAEGIDGALQEYICWPKEDVFPLPSSFTPQEGALLEPLGVAIHALRLGSVLPGMDVGVLGSGPIGLLTIQLAKAAGAARIFATDKLSHRLELARECGATDTMLASGDEADQILSKTNGRGLDVIFEAAGDDGSAVESAVNASKRGATVVVIGIPSIERTIFTASTSRRKGLTIKISRRMINTYPTAIKLVTNQLVNLSTLITHQFPLEAYKEAFSTAANRFGAKVFINFD